MLLKSINHHIMLCKMDEQILKIGKRPPLKLKSGCMCTCTHEKNQCIAQGILGYTGQIPIHAHLAGRLPALFVNALHTSREV